MRAVILYSIGSPETLDKKCIKHYLKNFLSDKNVVKINSFLWQPILQTFILTTRPERLLKRYSEIFEDGQNPYLRDIESLAGKLQVSLNQATEDASSEPYVVRHAYAYIQPSFEKVVQECIDAGAKEIVTIPLFPQYTHTTSKRPLLILESFASKHGDCTFKMVKSFSGNKLYIKTIADQVRPYLEAAFEHENTAPPHLLITYHNLPVNYLKMGDPYLSECKITTKALAKELELKDWQYTLTFQSKMGPMCWIKPYIEDSCNYLLETNHTNMVVVAPGFTVDCIETLFDLGHNLKTRYLSHGGEHISFVPGLNASDAHVKLLQELIDTAEVVKKKG